MKNKEPNAEFYFHSNPPAKKGEKTEEAQLLRNSFSLSPKTHPGNTDKL